MTHLHLARSMTKNLSSIDTPKQLSRTTSPGSADAELTFATEEELDEHLTELLLRQGSMLDARLESDEAVILQTYEQEEKTLRTMVAQQTAVLEQINELRRHVLSQDQELNNVLGEVHSIMAEYGISLEEFGSAEDDDPQHDPALQADSAPIVGVPVGSERHEEEEPKDLKGGESVSNVTSDLPWWCKTRCLRRCCLALSRCCECQVSPRTARCLDLLSRVARSQLFDLLATGVIFLNAILIGVSTQYAFDHLGSDTPRWIIAFDYFFLSFYVFELSVKLIAFRLRFFYGQDWHWNIFDLALVALGLYDLIIDEAFPSSSASLPGSNNTFFRMIRLLKMLKLLRVVRVMRSCRPLRVILNAIIGSILSLFWALVMLAAVLYVFSIAFMQAAAGYLGQNDNKIDLSIKEKLEEHWQDPLQSVRSLYLAIMGGNDWMEYSEPLWETGEPFYYLFLFYITFMAIAVLNVLTGIFVDASIDVGKEDDKNVLQLEIQAGNDMKSLLGRVDTSGSGRITKQEFLDVLTTDEGLTWCAVMNIEKAVAVDWFDELADLGDGTWVAIDELADGLERLEGAPTSMDLLHIALQHHRFRLQMACFAKFVSTGMNSLLKALENRFGGPLMDPEHVVPLQERLNKPKVHFPFRHEKGRG